MDTEILTIGLASFVYCLSWASLSHKEFPNWNSPCSLKFKVSISFFTSSEKEISTKILDIESVLGAAFFMQTYKILALILVGEC